MKGDGKTNNFIDHEGFAPEEYSPLPHGYESWWSEDSGTTATRESSGYRIGSPEDGRA